MPKQLTPCEQRGYKAGMRFRYLGVCNVQGSLTLIEDDGTELLPFLDERDSTLNLSLPWFLSIRRIKPIIRVRAGEPFEHLLPKPEPCNCGSWTCPICAKPD